MAAILAIDTATGPCSVAVWRDGRIAAYVENAKPVMQSASLMPMVEQALKTAEIGYDGLSCVAATIGPGSFTGIRVGLAAARGIAFAGRIPSLGFTTLDVLAFAALPLAHGAAVLALINAGKGEYYYRMYDGTEPRFPPRLASLETALAEAAAGYALAGNMPADCPGKASGVHFPRADALAGLAAAHPEMAQPMTPFYIRPPDAKLPKARA